MSGFQFAGYGTVSRWLKYVIIAVLFAALQASSHYSYLLFHSLAEIFSIVIAFVLFFVSWNTREYTTEPGLTFIGIAYLFVGVIDLFHTLSYKGMNIFTDYQFYANQLWVGARYLESISLLVFVLKSRKHDYRSSRRPDKIRMVYGDILQVILYSIITVLILLSIFYWKIFPECFVQLSEDGKGYQTLFKIASGYIVILILFVSTVLMRKMRDSFAPQIYRMLTWSLITTIGSEFCFTLYISNYGAANLVGHYLKIVSFYMVYRSIIASGLRDPFQVMFKSIMENEQKILVAKEAAESANRAKSNFIANMSHEIRTPLNAILGFASILRKTESDPVARNYLESIYLSGQSLLTIVNDILDLSKIESGRSSLRLHPVSLFELFREIRAVFSLQIEKKGLEFRMNIDNLSPVIPDVAFETGNASNIYFVTDEVRLRQILFNLVGNSVKFTNSGYISLYAQSLVHREESWWNSSGGDNSTVAEGYTDSMGNFTGYERFVDLRIVVEDSGIGMTESFLKEVFIPFRQQENSSGKKSGEGTGLGLAITKRLVEAMNGTISVSSRSGEGTRFEILFPEVGITRFRENRTVSNKLPSETAPPDDSTNAINYLHRDEEGSLHALPFPDKESLMLFVSEDVTKQWERAVQNQHIPEIEIFAETVRSLGESNSIPFFVEFSEKLLFYIDLFDVNRIKSVLNEFPVLVAKL